MNPAPPTIRINLPIPASPLSLDNPGEDVPTQAQPPMPPDQSPHAGHATGWLTNGPTDSGSKGEFLSWRDPHNLQGFVQANSVPLLLHLTPPVMAFMRRSERGRTPVFIRWKHARLAGHRNQSTWRARLLHSCGRRQKLRSCMVSIILTNKYNSSHPKRFGRECAVRPERRNPASWAPQAATRP